MTGQRGGFVMGLVVGLLVGLALALGVALYITKAPVPFINKVPQRTAEQDIAETERNRHWDPNVPLGGGAAARPLSPAASGAVAAAAPAASVPAAALPPVVGKAAARDPAALLPGGSTAPAAVRPTGTGIDPYVYFVQAGAFTRNDDAEQQRARLALTGQTARITEREQAGRTVYRVRMGPFPTRDEADALYSRLQEQGVEAQIVRVERP